MQIKTDTLIKANEDDLVFLKEKCAGLIYQINKAAPSRREEIHETLLPKVFKKLGQNTWFDFPLNVDYGIFTTIGADCYFNHHLSIGDGGRVKIGSHVIVGPYVGIYTADHPLDVALRNKGLISVSDIEIEDNVFIGANVTILGGVKIGRNSVIGAGSVVTKSIEPYSLAVGVPARVIKKLK
ncbi:MAG: sugar O-acetyltransferase [Alphaproteobacteria bacterium]|nr:sugar O-acetyltransferase [Alphaproteobacteria bacterium]